MMKKSLMVFAILVFSMFGMIRLNEPISVGDELEIHTNIDNPSEEKYENVHLRILIYDLGEVIETNVFDISKEDKIRKWSFWNTNNVESGTYLARIVLSSDDFRYVKHRYITVV